MWWWCCVHGVLLWVSLILQAGKRINGISRDTSATITWIRWTSSGGASSYRWGPTRRQKNTLRNRSHTYISDLSPKKSFPSPPPKKSATPQRPWLTWAAALPQPFGHFCVPATPTKSATSIEPRLVARNARDHEAQGLGTFVAALRQFLERRWKT